jgi:hypothetical protein
MWGLIGYIASGVLIIIAAKVLLELLNKVITTHKLVGDMNERLKRIEAKLPKDTKEKK